MLREIAEAIELLASTRQVILVLEDLHLGDESTLQLVSYLSRRNGPARLLIVGTARYGETVHTRAF